MKIIVLIIILSIISCKGPANIRSYNDSLGKADSLTDTVKEKIQEAPTKEYNNPTNAIIDTFGLYKSPVKVISARIVREGYNCDLKIKFKNISKKSIDGIKFRWYCLTAFKNAATIDGIPDMGYGSGLSDDDLKPNNTVTKTWEITSDDAKIILIAWPTEVAFKNGDNWKIGP